MKKKKKNRKKKRKLEEVIRDLGTRACAHNTAFILEEYFMHYQYSRVYC